MGLLFTPQRMKSTLNALGGPALPTQFMTIIVPPTGMMGSLEFKALSAATGLSVLGSLGLSVMTEKASIPGKSFSTSDIIMHGKHMKMPYSVQHTNFRMTFICTNSMIERTFFDIWTQYIQKPDSHYMEYFDQYKTTIVIKKLSGSGLIESPFADPSSTPTANEPQVEIGSALSTYYLQDAYPISIGSQELSSSDTQGYLTLDVEFAYTHFRCVLDDLVPLVLKDPNYPGTPEETIVPIGSMTPLFPTVG